MCLFRDVRHRFCVFGQRSGMKREVSDQVVCLRFLPFVLFEQGFPLLDTLVQDINRVRRSAEFSGRQDDRVAVAIGSISVLPDSLVLALLILLLSPYPSSPALRCVMLDRRMVGIRHCLCLRQGCSVRGEQGVTHGAYIVQQNVLDKHLRIGKESLVLHADADSDGFSYDIAVSFLQDIVLSVPVEASFVFSIEQVFIFLSRQDRDLVCRPVQDVAGRTEEQIAVGTYIYRIVAGLIARGRRDGVGFGIAIAAGTSCSLLIPTVLTASFSVRTPKPV